MPFDKELRHLQKCRHGEQAELLDHDPTDAVHRHLVLSKHLHPTDKRPEDSRVRNA